MANNVYGESSKDVINDETDISQPKLKKARFLWEVKGKHHLKEDENKISHENQSQDGMNSLNVSSNKELENNPSTRNKSNRSLVNNNCCVQSFLQKTEHFFDSRMGDNCFHTFNHNDMDHADFVRWHNKQMIRYNIENRINAAMDICLNSNLTGTACLDVSNIADEIENDIEVNNQGILMAIKSCGLKTHYCLPKEIQQDPCHMTNKCAPSKNSVPDSNVDINEPEIHMTHTNDSISNGKSLQTDEPRNYEMNSKFWNTAVSAAIYEKGLTYHE